MRWTANVGGIRGSWNMCKVLIGRPQRNRSLTGNRRTRGHWIVAAVSDSGENPTTHGVIHKKEVILLTR